jgi:hypothetical protein
LTAVFRRLWPSTCDALADGSVDVSALRDLFARTLAGCGLTRPQPIRPCQQRQQELMQARERQVRFRLHTCGAQHLHPAVIRTPARRPGQRGLADSWLTAYD